MKIKSRLGDIWIKANSIWAHTYSYSLTVYAERWVTINIKYIKRKSNDFRNIF